MIQSNTMHHPKLGLMGRMRAQESYIDTSTAQVTAQGLFGSFSFPGLKKLKGGDSWIHSTAQRKEHSRTEFGKKFREKVWRISKWCLCFFWVTYIPKSSTTSQQINQPT